jgi:hypothetical protein
VEAVEPGVGCHISGETHARTAEDMAAAARQWNALRDQRCWDCECETAVAASCTLLSSGPSAYFWSATDSTNGGCGFRVP